MGASSRRPKNRHIAYKVSKYVPEKRLLDAKSIRKIDAKVPPWGFQCFVESLDAQQRAYLDKSIQTVHHQILQFQGGARRLHQKKNPPLPAFRPAVAIAPLLAFRPTVAVLAWVNHEG